MTTPTLLASSLAAAAVMGSQFTAVPTTELVSSVNAQETGAMVLTAPTWYAEAVPVEPVESITLSLTNPASDIRASAILDETEEGKTAVEVSVYGNADPRNVQAQLQLGTCDNPDAESVQVLTGFTRYRSQTVLDTSLEALVNQTEPVSLAVIDRQNQQVVGCSNL